MAFFYFFYVRTVSIVVKKIFECTKENYRKYTFNGKVHTERVFVFKNARCNAVEWEKI